MLNHLIANRWQGGEVLTGKHEQMKLKILLKAVLLSGINCLSNSHRLIASVRSLSIFNMQMVVWL